MIDYELALQLKEAGFPQVTAVTDDPTSYVHHPTIPNLIEALGDKLAILVHFDKGTKWSAKAQDRYLSKEGSTMDEALARLWLGIENDEYDR